MNIKCPVCDSKVTKLWSKTKDYEYLTSEEEYNYFECLDCNTIFLENFPISKLKEIYPKNYYSFIDQKQNLALTIKEYFDKQYLNKVLKSFNGRKINILDIGGGTGWLLDVIRKIYPNIDITQIVDIDDYVNLIINKR